MMPAKKGHQVDRIMQMCSTVSDSVMDALHLGGGNQNVRPEGELIAFEPDGPKEERIIEVPARKKGHLLGLHGQTIEKIRQTSGVIKCHIIADRGQLPSDRRRTDKEGNIQVQIFGTREHVEACQDLVERVVAGDHSGIGHSSVFMPVDPGKVNRLRGDHWQVINALKDLTSTYLDILQGPQEGLQVGEAQLFIAGPHECVEQAKNIVSMLPPSFRCVALSEALVHLVHRRFHGVPVARDGLLEEEPVN